MARKGLFLLLIALVFNNMGVFAQNIGVNGTGNNPDPSAMLHVEAADKGLIIPRVGLDDTANAAPIGVAPAEGLMIYNETGTAPKGYYYWDSGKGQWLQVGTGAEDDDWYYESGNKRFLRNEGTEQDCVLVGTNTGGPTYSYEFAVDNGESDGTQIGVGSIEYLRDESSTTQISDDFEPIPDGTEDLGASTHRWDRVYGIDFHVDGSISDNGGNTGTAGQVLSSTGGGVDWLDQGALNDDDWERDATDGELFPNNLADQVGVGLNNPGYRFETSGNDGYTVGAFYNADGGGTGVVGTGSDAGTYYTMIDGAGVSGAGNNIGTAGWGLQDSSSGVYGSNDPEGTYGYLGTPNWGAFGGNPSGNYGALGGATWAGYFWGDVRVETADPDEDIVMDDYGGGGEVTIRPSNYNWGSGGYGYVGTYYYAWDYMYAENYNAPSDRKRKEDIHTLSRANSYAYLMEDIEEMELAFYKYKDPDEKEERTYSLGTFTDASPAYVQDETLSGISLYDYTSLAMAGVKHLNDRVEELEEKGFESKDMGNAEWKGGDRVRVTYSEAFSKGVKEYGDPVLDLTPIGGNADLYVVSRDSEGFTIGVEEAPEGELSIDWVAEIQVPKEDLEPKAPDGLKDKLEVSEEERERIRQKMKKRAEERRKDQSGNQEQEAYPEKKGGKRKEKPGKRD